MELHQAAVELLNFQPQQLIALVEIKPNVMEALLLRAGRTAQLPAHRAVGAIYRNQLEAGKQPPQLRASQKKRQGSLPFRRLLQGGASHLRFAGNVQIGILAVGEKEFFLRRVVLPPHPPRLFEINSAGFDQRGSPEGVTLHKVSREGFDPVVVALNPRRYLLR